MTQTHRAAALVVLALALLVGCNERPTTEIQVSSETHWLRACDSDTICGPYACVCNVCTLACETDDVCAQFGPGISCSVVGRGPAGELCFGKEEPGMCLPSCPDGTCDLAGTAATGLTCEQQTCLPSDVIEEVRTRNPVDVLFVVDNSGSMCEEQAQLRENLDVFVQNLLEAGVNLRAAVVTTDVTNRDQSGAFQNEPDTIPGPACTIAVDVSVCPTESPLGLPPPALVLDSLNPYYRPGGVPDIATFQRDLGCNATVGTRGDGFEQGLEAARLALSSPLLETTNAGFLRDDALLAVVFVTDENDCSNDGLNLSNGNDCEWFPEDLTSTSEYQDFFATLKGGDTSRVVLAGIIAPDEGTRWTVGEDVLPSCTSDLGEGYAGWRYAEVINAFPHHAIENICADNFSDGLSQIAATILMAL